MQPNRLPDLPAGKISRRAFVMSTLATGFALAVRPVSAQTITTDAAGVEAGEVQMAVGEITIPAYRAMPQAAGTFPVVLVVQEIFGVHKHVKDVCRRFAKLGYVAIAPELYARHGDVSQRADIGAIILTVVRKVPDAQVMAGLDATVNWVESSDRGDVRKPGITGFCWGGRIVRMYAAHSPKVNAGVAWYGCLAGQTSERTPTHPVDVVSQLHAPVLGLYAGPDSGIPQEKVEQMRAALQTAGSSSELHVYPDTPHGFHADYRSSYRKEAAQDGWQRLQAWFTQHGAA